MRSLLRSYPCHAPVFWNDIDTYYQHSLHNHMVDLGVHGFLSSSECSHCPKAAVLWEVQVRDLPGGSGGIAEGSEAIDVS